MKIAIEGMDGVGKSTIANLIAQENNFTYLEKPLTELMETDNVDGKSNLENISQNIYGLDDEIIKAWFFGMGNLYSFMKYENEDLIVDRHFASNYFWNGSEKTKPIFQLMINYVGKPDITIVLYSSIETRLKRIYKRNQNDFDLSDKEKHVYGYDKMLYFLKEFDIPYVIVDTENKTIEEVCDEVQKIIDSLKKDNHIKKKVI